MPFKSKAHQAAVMAALRRRGAHQYTAIIGSKKEGDEELDFWSQPRHAARVARGKVKAGYQRGVKVKRISRSGGAGWIHSW